MTEDLSQRTAALVREHLAMPRERVHSLTTTNLNGKLVESLNLLGYLRDFVSASGMELVDAHGRRYLDFLAGYGSVPLGHNHPAVAAAVRAAIDAVVPHFILMAPEALPAALAARIAAISPRSSAQPSELSMAFFMSSGSEAVDGALKLARAVTRRPRFVAAQRGYHGATFGAMAVTGDARLEVFEPLGERTLVPWGDAALIEAQLQKRDVAAVILEPIQAEGGVNLPPAGYLAEVQRLCRRYGTLFILDEVQTGLGRTGTWFACERDGVVPDVLVLAKALSGGLVPISAYVTRPDLWRKAYGTLATCELHCTTYRGGPLACAAALATIEVIEATGLVARADKLGEQLGTRLRAVTAGHPLIREVRGRGLLWGIELAASKDGVAAALIAQWLVVGLLERGIVTQVTTLSPTVIRVEPPLILEEAHIERFCDALRDVLATHATGTIASLVGVGKHLIKQRLDAVLGRAPS
ncbi:MAG: putrescine aminotransferase [Myxococcales bacterium]|nr:putrescine aminotransferase [Myxococcales bacterium]